MKKNKKQFVLFVATILLVFSQTYSQNSFSIDTGSDKQEVLLNNFDYNTIKKLSEKRKVTVESVRQKMSKINEDDVEISKPEIEDLLTDICALRNQELNQLFLQFRKENLGSNKDLNEASTTFFKQVDANFNGENAILVSLKSANSTKLMSIQKASFGNLFGILLDYVECLLCCSRETYPDIRIPILKIRFPQSIRPMKADYSHWYANKICGFELYDFPCTFKKARFKFSGIGIALLAANLFQEPRFRNYSPNGTAVHVPMIPVALVLGWSNLSTPPCQNQQLMDKLKQHVGVRCK